MNHLIKKQIIDLRIGKRADAFRMQQKVSTQYWKEIVPILQKVFDKISNEEEVIELDKFEIDLGVISEKAIEQNKWGEDLEMKIEKQLRELLLVTNTNKNILKKTKPVSICKQWLRYMQNGYLPWNTLKADEQWYEQILEGFAVDFESVHALRNLIETDATALKRVAGQHPQQFLINLTAILTATKQSGLQDIIEELYILFIFLQQKSKVQDIITENEFKRNIWMKVLILAAEVNKDFSTEGLSAQLVRAFVNEYAFIQKLPVKIAARLKITKPFIEQASQQLKALYKKENERISKAVKKLGDTGKEEKGDIIQPETVLQHDALQNTIQQAHIGEAVKDVYEKDKPAEMPVTAPVKKIIDVLDEEGIFVTNAGVVLLHPFLRVLFNRSQLVQDTQFISIYTQQKALYLLHYLATGNVYAAEHELAIAKVLCAYPLEETVDTGIELPNEILIEAGDMLTAVITQWSILKNTSHGGLREGFLQRSGKLFSKDDKLYLQVEQSAIDILLDHLPWNLSVIKLPWMPDILRVEWR